MWTSRIRVFFVVITYYATLLFVKVNTKLSIVFYSCGPRENRTPASAMRMPRNTTLLWAR